MTYYISYIGLIFQIAVIGSLFLDHYSTDTLKIIAIIGWFTALLYNSNNMLMFRLTDHQKKESKH